MGNHDKKGNLGATIPGTNFAPTQQTKKYLVDMVPVPCMQSQSEALEERLNNEFKKGYKLFHCFTTTMMELILIYEKI